MSVPSRLVWLPESLCERTSQELDALLAGFCSRWGLSVPSPAQVSRANRAQAAGRADEDRIDLAQVWPERLRHAVAQALFQRPFTESAILRGVLDRIERNLQLALAEKFAPAETLALGDGDYPGHAGLVCDIEWLQCHLRLTVSCDQLRNQGWLAQPAPRPALERVDLERALARTQVPLIAQLGSATVNVGDLLHLVPGDVLLLSESLDEPLQVTSPGSSLALRALLGGSVPSTGSTAARHRAMRCLPLQAS